MPALSEDVLKKLITPNAKALSSPKGDQFIDEGRVGKADDFDDSMFLAETYDERGGAGMVSEAYQYDPNAAQILASRKTTDYSSNNFNPDRVKNSGMLSAIKEEMVKHPIDTAALNTQLIESAGGGMDRFSKMIAGAKQVGQRADELDGKGATSTRRQSSPGNGGYGGGGIDYALIKTIVNEAIETKLKEFTENGELRIIRFDKGRLKVIDNSGNIYSAPLKYEGNMKDKKQGGQ